jgi:hypothetical protein
VCVYRALFKVNACCLDLSSYCTHASEQVFLEVECVVRVLLDHLKDLDGLCDDLEVLCELDVLESTRACVTSGPTPSPICN